MLHHWQADSVGHREGVTTHMERATSNRSLYVIYFLVLAFYIQHSRSYSEKLPHFVSDVLQVSVCLEVVIPLKQITRTADTPRIGIGCIAHLMFACLILWFDPNAMRFMELYFCADRYVAGIIESAVRSLVF